jgi:SAM-dependent methyltransferase
MPPAALNPEFALEEQTWAREQTRISGSATAAALRLLWPYPAGLMTEVSPRDHMYNSNPEGYATIGHLALLAVRMAMLDARKRTARQILDLPSGHGRVLRFLKAEYPRAQLTACDIDRDAADFCAETFGASAVYGHEVPNKIELPQDRFDLIWCGSLLTHFDQPLWHDFFDLFESALCIGGLLVLTTGGRDVAARLVDPEFRDDYIKPESQRQAILKSYIDTGFGFATYDFPKEHADSLSLPDDYGLSLARPSFVCSLIERRSGLKLVTLNEGGWDPLDVIACVRVE